MRVHESVVLGAKLGESSDFDLIVRRYEDPLYRYAVSELGRDEAEDAVQEVFLKAFLGLRRLRDCGRFEAWLYALARNELRSRLRRRRAAAATAETDPDELPALASRDEVEAAEIRGLLARLPPEQAAVVRLRHWADLSLREIGLVEGIPEKLAKSRLWEAMEALRSLHAEGRALTGRRVRLSRPAPPPGFEERAMDKVEKYRNGAAVFERLGLAEQLDLVAAARACGRWGEGLLAALGRTPGGPDFVRDYEARLGLRELATLVSVCDRHTEKRLVRELERRDPEAAEALKEQMFVFEDFSLFDGAALALLCEGVGSEVLALGLVGIEAGLRAGILARLPEGPRSGVEEAMGRCRATADRVRAAQEEAVAWAYEADQAGRLARRKDESAPHGFVVTRA